MRYSIYVILIFLGWHATSAYSQDMVMYDKLITEYKITPSDITLLHGYVDNALPITVAYFKKDGTLKGLINYDGSEEFLIIEGSNTDSITSLYEFEEATLLSVLQGPHVNTSSSWTWNTPDYSLSLPLTIYKHDHVQKGKVVVYIDKEDKDRSQVLLRPDKAQVSIELENAVNLRWMDFSCEKNDCIEGRPDMILENPVEFRLDKNTLTVLPHKELYKLHELSYETDSEIGESYFTTYSYPVLGQRKFDNWIEGVIKTKKENNSQSNEGERFENRSHGDFYITLLSKELICGYLVFYNNETSRMETIPFNYNRSKNKFYRIKDIFRKDFNFSFFLKSYIDKQKRNILYKEESIIKELIKGEPFSHYNFSPSGLVFFTDFNTIFGRRHILIPFEEIESFIGDKTITNYLKKERFR